MSSRFNELIEVLMGSVLDPVTGNPLTRERAEELIRKNASISSSKIEAARGFFERVRTKDQVLADLQNLQDSFSSALDLEMESTFLSEEKKAALKFAKKSPTMDFRLISDYGTRQALETQWNEIALSQRSNHKLRSSFCLSSIRQY